MGREQHLYIAMQAGWQNIGSLGRAGQHSVSGDHVVIKTRRLASTAILVNGLAGIYGKCPEPESVKECSWWSVSQAAAVKLPSWRFGGAGCWGTC